jgi:hypothetical protein
MLFWNEAVTSHEGTAGGAAGAGSAAAEGGGACAGAGWAGAGTARARPMYIPSRIPAARKRSGTTT